VNATVKVTEAGAPMPNFQVAILPFEGKTYPVSKLPVLAKICGAPAACTVDANKTIDAYTDSSGEVKFSIDVGTTPGALPIEVRPTDQSSTELQTVDLNRVDQIDTLHITPLAGAPLRCRSRSRGRSSRACRLA
jgi:hypothetical protein